MWGHCVSGTGCNVGLFLLTSSYHCGFLPSSLPTLWQQSKKTFQRKTEKDNGNKMM